MTYCEAYKTLKIDSNQSYGLTLMIFAQEKLPKSQVPSQLWMNKADAFINWSHAQLMENSEAQSEIIKRGFTLDSDYNSLPRPTVAS